MVWVRLASQNGAYCVASLAVISTRSPAATAASVERFAGELRPVAGHVLQRRTVRRFRRRTRRRTAPASRRTARMASSSPANCDELETNRRRTATNSPANCDELSRVPANWRTRRRTAASGWPGRRGVPAMIAGGRIVASHCARTRYAPRGHGRRRLYRVRYWRRATGFLEATAATFCRTLQ